MKTAALSALLVLALTLLLLPGCSAQYNNYGGDEEYDEDDDFIHQLRQDYDARGPLGFAGDPAGDGEYTDGEPALDRAAAGNDRSMYMDDVYTDDGDK